MKREQTKNISAEELLQEHHAVAPMEFDNDIVWAAWLYYVDELTQSDVAKIIGVSRATIVNLLREARQQNIVSISVNADISMRTALAKRLAAHYGLSGALVISEEGTLPLIERLGNAGARVLEQHVEPNDVIGVAWGRTVLAAARAISSNHAIPSLTVVQVYGSTFGTTDFSPEFCTSLLANRLGARCVNLLAPALVSQPALQKALLQEPILTKQFNLIRSATKIIFGVGDIGPLSTVRRAELAPAEIFNAYAKAGSKGMIIGRFINHEGAPVSGELDERMIGISLDELRQIPVRICLSGGREKREATLATLLGHYVTHLVTDSVTAAWLLQQR